MKRLSGSHVKSCRTAISLPVHRLTRTSKGPFGFPLWPQASMKKPPPKRTRTAAPLRVRNHSRTRLRRASSRLRQSQLLRLRRSKQKQSRPLRPPTSFNITGAGGVIHTIQGTPGTMEFARSVANPPKRSPAAPQSDGGNTGDTAGAPAPELKPRNPIAPLPESLLTPPARNEMMDMRDLPASQTAATASGMRHEPAAPFASTDVSPSAANNGGSA